MLNASWNLSRQPFDKSIKPDHLFVSAGFRELNSRLDYMKQHRGIMLLSGQPGARKTTARRAFVSQLSELSYLYIGDGEHFTIENLQTLEQFNLGYLFPVPQQPSLVAKLPALNYQGCWAGYAVAETEYQRPPLNQKI